MSSIYGKLHFVCTFELYEPLAFRADESSDDVAELAGRRFSILFYVQLAFSANCRGAALTVKRMRKKTRIKVSIFNC